MLGVNLTLEHAEANWAAFCPGKTRSRVRWFWSGHSPRGIC